MLKLLEQRGGLSLSENLFPKHQCGDRFAPTAQFENVQNDNRKGETK